jgi:hypothetical protein
MIAKFKEKKMKAIATLVLVALLCVPAFAADECEITLTIDTWSSIDIQTTATIHVENGNTDGECQINWAWGANYDVDINATLDVYEGVPGTWTLNSTAEDTPVLIVDGDSQTHEWASTSATYDYLLVEVADLSWDNGKGGFDQPAAKVTLVLTTH